MAEQFDGPINLTPDLHFEESLYPNQKGPLADLVEPIKTSGSHFTPEETITKQNNTLDLTVEEINDIEQVRAQGMSLFETTYAGSSTLRNPNYVINNEEGSPRLVYLASKEEEKTGDSDTRYNRIASSVRDSNTTGSFNSGTAYREGGLMGSPIAPFAAGIYKSYNDPFSVARDAICTSLNCFRTPMADLERSKMFRNIFISRPECYIMAHSIGGTTNEYNILSEQCYNDNEFSSSYQMYPHVARLLSPSYVCDMSLDGTKSNWNWLLTNRITSLNNRYEQTVKTSANTKSTIGSSIISGGSTNVYEPRTITATFRDTRHLDVYEMIRMWMLYISKSTRGELVPSYNGYQFRNVFIRSQDQSKGSKIEMSGDDYTTLHPYDRAIDYACTIFDIICDETNMKVVNWSKAYGCFPISVSVDGLTNDSGSFALTKEVTVTVTFQCQCVRENVNMNLVEFNYNSGIVDALGRTIDHMDERCSEYVSHYIIRDQNDDLPFGKYRGAGNMFTGTPFIMMGDGTKSPSTRVDDKRVAAPYLFFLPIPTKYDSNGSSAVPENDVNRSINIGLTETRPNEFDSDTMYKSVNGDANITTKTEKVEFQQLPPEPIKKLSEVYNVPSVSMNEALAKVNISETQQAIIDALNKNAGQYNKNLDTYLTNIDANSMIDAQSSNSKYNDHGESSLGGKLTPDLVYDTGFGVEISRYLTSEHDGEMPNGWDPPDKRTINSDNVRGIVIHNTPAVNSYLTSEVSAAESHTHMQLRGALSCITHFFVDDRGAWQAYPIDSCSYNAAHPTGNNKTISVEIIEFYTGEESGAAQAEFNRKAEENASKLVAYLCVLYNIKCVDHSEPRCNDAPYHPDYYANDGTGLTQHWTWIGKDCPQALRHQVNGSMGWSKWVEHTKLKVDKYKHS